MAFADFSCQLGEYKIMVVEKVIDEMNLDNFIQHYGLTWLSLIKKTDGTHPYRRVAWILIIGLSSIYAAKIRFEVILRFSQGYQMTFV